MQDLNNENTVPMKPDREPEETVPTPVSREPLSNDPAGETRPTPVSHPANPPAEPAAPVYPPDEPAEPVYRTAAASSPTVATLPNSSLPPAPKPARPRRWPWVVLGILLIFVFGGAGGWMGYRNAIQMRKDKMAEQRIQTATEHFMLGLQAQNNKQYQIAQQQYEYVIRLDPTFPGVQDKLREVMVTMAIKETPTPQPTVALPTATPTKDTRPQEEIYNQARQQYAAKDWDALFATIDSLRQIDPKYRAVEVDDMLYVALRYRGVDKILHQANLEGGLYDLALAERFGPLDQDAKGYRNWARLYLSGSSFWEVDWVKVMEVFEQIYPSFPNMRDASGLTAIERYRIAAKGQGDKLNAAGDYCGAYDYYQKSLQAVPDGELAQTATAVYDQCHPATATPEPTQAATVTPSQAAPVPTIETPGVTVTPPTAAPTSGTPEGAAPTESTPPTANP